MDQRTELEVRLGDISNEIQSIRQTIRYLAPLAGIGESQPEDISNLGITDAVRAALSPEERMSAAEIKTAMEQRGFDFSNYSAPDATIRTILKRLVEANKAEEEKDGYNRFYKFVYTNDDMPF